MTTMIDIELLHPVVYMHVALYLACDIAVEYLFDFSIDVILQILL